MKIVFTFKWSVLDSSSDSVIVEFVLCCNIQIDLDQLLAIVQGLGDFSVSYFGQTISFGIPTIRLYCESLHLQSTIWCPHTSLKYLKLYYYYLFIYAHTTLDILTPKIKTFLSRQEEVSLNLCVFYLYPLLGSVWVLALCVHNIQVIL